ncbi:MAG: LLM class flavin-dependent oxidoreductase [Pseudomonadales bacterium]|nr:LLM class flavin-dependent oxidoreductase [Pseudomonadales bacterium]
MQQAVNFAINRLDLTSADGFADSAVRAEALGWHMGLIPCNPLKVADPYVALALAARATRRIHLGVLLDNPVLRHPAVLAGSIATVAQMAPGRIHLGIGSGDTAVRFNGLVPATVNSLATATQMTQRLLAGEKIEVGALKPASLQHATQVPVWLAAQGPKTLRMAGTIADGVFIRVGRDPANLKAAWQAVCDGAREVGRNPADIQLALIFHTAFSTDSRQAKLMAKAVAAGYYEYSPLLFENIGLDWKGPSAHQLREDVYPDFHHHWDPEYAGKVVDFLDDAAADAFALYGDWDDIAQQLSQVLDIGLPVSTILPHPILPAGSKIDYLQACAQQLLNQFAALP